VDLVSHSRASLKQSLKTHAVVQSLSPSRLPPKSMRGAGLGRKAAVTVRFPFIVTVSGLSVPLASPDQPVKA